MRQNGDVEEKSLYWVMIQSGGNSRALQGTDGSGGDSMFKTFVSIRYMRELGFPGGTPIPQSLKVCFLQNLPFITGYCSCNPKDLVPWALFGVSGTTQQRIIWTLCGACFCQRLALQEKPEPFFHSRELLGPRRNIMCSPNAQTGFPKPHHSLGATKMPQ